MPALLTLAEFNLRYDGESGYEYWFGEVIKKSMVTRLHGALAGILIQLMTDAGYFTTTEVDLRIDSEFQPRPDVLAELYPDMTQDYPTKPDGVIAIEVLSPDDTMSRVFRKCRNYRHIGVTQVFVFDPEARVAWQWSRETENLERFAEVQLGNGAVLKATTVWAELDRRLNRGQ
jgi:Uma2 family endonuclease